jgi:GNAT superfamily N-acetyltransferase
MTKSEKRTGAGAHRSPAPPADEAASAAALGSTEIPAPATDGAGAVGDACPAVPGPEVRVRRARADDAGTIAEIVVRGWQAAYRGILPGGFLAGLSVAAREVAWRSILESDGQGAAPAWIAEVEGRAVGFVASGPQRDEDVPLLTAEVYAIYVLPEAWRQGVGRALLETAADHWRGGGAATLVLWVFEANARGRAFYTALGWHADGALRQVELGGVSITEIRHRLAL